MRVHTLIVNLNGCDGLQRPVSPQKIFAKSCAIAAPSKTHTNPAHAAHTVHQHTKHTMQMIKSFTLAVLIVALAVSGVVRRVAAAAGGWWLFSDAFRHSSTLSLF